MPALGHITLVAPMLVFSLVACSNAEPTLDETTHIGSLDDNQARIGITIGATQVEAYVCGAGDTLLTHTRWFVGERQASGETVLQANDWTLRIDVNGRDLSGALESPSGELSLWTAARTPNDPTSEVGLYDDNTYGCRTGVIVWGDQPGPACDAQGSYCDDAGNRSQVTPVECAPDQAIRVLGVRDGQDVDITVERVVPL